MCSYIRINYNKCIHLFPSFVTIIDFFLLPCFSPPKPGESQHDKRSSAAWLHAQSRVPAPSSDATSPSLPHSCLHALQTLTDLITPLLGNKKNVEASVLTRNKDRGCQNWVNKMKMDRWNRRMNTPHREDWTPKYDLCVWYLSSKEWRICFMCLKLQFFHVISKMFS